MYQTHLLNVHILLFFLALFPFLLAIAITRILSRSQLFRYSKTNLLTEMICFRSYGFSRLLGNTRVCKAYLRIYILLGWPAEK